MLRSPSGANGYARTLRRIGAQHLHRVRAARRRVVGRGGSGSGWRGCRVSVRTTRRTGLRWSSGCRVLPALTEGVGESRDRRAVHLELHVVPRRARAVACVELDRLRVAAVAGVVVAAVAEVDAADERHVVVGPSGAADHEQLLVVAARRGAPARRAAPRRRPRLTSFVSARFCCSAKLRLASGASATAARARARRAPRRSASTVRQLGAGPGEALVGVAVPVGEVHPVAGVGASTAPRSRRREVGRAVDQHLDPVALAPARGARAAVDPRRRVAPVRGREEPGRGPSRLALPHREELPERALPGHVHAAAGPGRG